MLKKSMVDSCISHWQALYLLALYLHESCQHRNVKILKHYISVAQTILLKAMEVVKGLISEKSNEITMKRVFIPNKNWSPTMKSERLMSSFSITMQTLSSCSKSSINFTQYLEEDIFIIASWCWISENKLNMPFVMAQHHSWNDGPTIRRHHNITYSQNINTEIF